MKRGTSLYEWPDEIFSPILVGASVDQSLNHYYLIALLLEFFQSTEYMIKKQKWVFHPFNTFNKF